MFYLNTDASAYAISAVLLQKHKENLLPVAYFSKALRKAETRYPAIQLEHMAIVKGISTFRNILYGRQFTILSNNKPLDKYKKTTSPAGIITRWLMELEEYLFSNTFLENKISWQTIYLEPQLIKIVLT